MEKTKHTHFLQYVTSGLLIFALIITGAIAYASSHEKKTNVFTVGSIKMDLLEPSWDDNAQVLNNPENGEHITDEDGSLVKGQAYIYASQAIEKDPQIKNIGKNTAYAYIKVTVPKATVDGQIKQLFDYDYDATHWTLFKSETSGPANNVYYYYYNTTLLTNTTTEPLFTSVHFINSNDGSLDNAILELTVDAYGIQTEMAGATDQISAWDVYQNQLGI